MLRPLYKAQEPFMEVPAGYGYLGVVMYDDIEDKCQCHICGKWFSFMGTHLRKTHKIFASEYKEQFGLAPKTALCSKSYSEQRERIANRHKRRWAKQGRTLKRWAKRNPISKQERRRRAHKGHFTYQRLNQIGLCEEQMKARFAVVRKIVGRVPSLDDLVRHDCALKAAICVRGTYNEFLKNLGLSGRRNYRWFPEPDVVLIAALRKWKMENKAVPTYRNFHASQNGYPSASAIKLRFGSWTKALAAAGLV